MGSTHTLNVNVVRSIPMMSLIIVEMFQFVVYIGAFYSFSQILNVRYRPPQKLLSLKQRTVAH